MADLFGFGVQKPAPKALGEEELKRDREISPLVRLMEESGQHQAAALTKANITPQEKSVIAKLVMGQGGAGAGTQQSAQAMQTIQAMLDSGKPEAYSEAKRAALSLPPQQASVAMKVIDNEEQKAEKKTKDMERRKLIEQNAYDVLKNIDNAPKPFGNIRSNIFASDSPQVADLKQAAFEGAGLLRQSEGGGNIGVRGLDKALITAGGNIGSLIGTDPKTLEHQLLNPLIRAGFGEEVERARQRFAQDKAVDNMEATPTPRPNLGSLGKYIGATDDSPIAKVANTTANLFLDTYENLASLARTAFPNIPKAGRLESSFAQDIAEDLLGFGLSMLIPGGPALGLGMRAVRSAIMLGAAKIGGSIGEKGYDIFAGKPKTESEANRKEGFKSAGSLLGARNSFSLVNQGLTAVRNRAAANATGNFPKTPPAGGGKPPSKGYNPSSDTGAVIDITPVQKGLEGVAKSAQSSAFTVAPLTRPDIAASAPLPQTHEQVMTAAALASQHLNQVSGGLVQQHGEIARPYVEVSQKIKESLDSGMKIVEQKRNAYMQAKERADSIPAGDTEAWSAADYEARTLEQQYKDSMINLADRQASASSQANVLSGMAVAQPEGTYAGEGLKQELNKSIETGVGVPENRSLGIQVISEANKNPVYINRFDSNNAVMMQQHNQAVESWKAESMERKMVADAAYQKEIERQDKEAYDRRKATIDASNDRVEAKNETLIRDAIRTALPRADVVRSMADTSIATARRLDELRKTALEPIGKEFEAIKRSLKKYTVPREAIVDISDAIEEASKESHGLVQSESTKKLTRLLDELVSKINNKTIITLRDLHETISEVGEIVNFSKYEGHSVNKLKHALKLMYEAFDRATEGIKVADKKKSGALSAILKRREANNAKYSALKDTFDNPEMGRLRSQGGENKEPSMKALLSGAEGLAKLGRALGADSREYESLLAAKMLEELRPVAKAGDNERKNRIVDEWSTREVIAVPKSLEQTLKALRLQRPQSIAPYQKRNLSAVSAPPSKWFKAPPKAVNVADMDAEQLWGLLDTESGIAKFKASVADSPLRQEYMKIKAVEIMDSEPHHGVGVSWAVGKLAKAAGIDKEIFKNATDPIIRWSNAMRNPERAGKIRALIGDDLFMKAKKELAEAEKLANTMALTKSSASHVAAYAVPSLLFLSPTIGAGVYSGLALIQMARHFKAKNELEARGYATKLS